MTSLAIRHLNKTFGQNAVLNDITLDVSEGEFFVVLGPSGGGKSTLLRILCGIETPDSGTITLAGRDITRLPPRERNVGMVFQDYGLYPHMNAWGNIAYGLEARGMPKAAIEQRVRAAAEKLGIAPLLQRVVVDLSGGEQQRVALARALAKDADLYLFDEPLSNLDPKLRVQARRDILMVHREKRKPTLYVTHDQTEALASGDRIGIVARGRLQQVGTAEDLIQRPANLFVAGFIGSPAMNLLPCTLSAENGGGVARYEDKLAVSLPPYWNAAINAYNRDEVVLGIPPSACFVPGTHDDAGGFVQAPIEDVEALVGELVVKLALHPETPFAALFQGMEDASFAPGSSLRLGIDAAACCLFDPTTEAALLPEA